MVLCTPEKVYWGMEKWVKPIPVLRGNGKNSPSSKGLEKGWKTNYTFFSNILEALITKSYTLRNNFSTFFSCSSIHLHPSSLVLIEEHNESLILTIK